MWLPSTAPSGAGGLHQLRMGVADLTHPKTAPRFRKGKLRSRDGRTFPSSARRILCVSLWFCSPYFQRQPDTGLLLTEPQIPVTSPPDWDSPGSTSEAATLLHSKPKGPERPLLTFFFQRKKKRRGKKASLRRANSPYIHLQRTLHGRSSKAEATRHHRYR